MCCWNQIITRSIAFIAILSQPQFTVGFTPLQHQSRRNHHSTFSESTQLSASKSTVHEINKWTVTCIFATSLLLSGPSFADEFGVEKDAPTLYTGETVEICTKRGPLGACLKTDIRTNTNDNDVSKKYFRDPLESIKQQASAARDGDDGNALIQKLRQQSIDNREKNDLYVARKTFEADQSATFGPFDSKVLIMNTDGRTFTLLDNPVAMRLRKDGFIDDKRGFIKQPTVDELEAAKTPKEGNGFLSSIFGEK